MLTIARSILDAIFPPRPETLLVRTLSPEMVQSLSFPSRYHETHYIYDYQSPSIRALIHENKYYKNHTAARLLATGLEDWLVKLAHQKSAPLLLVPIPLSRKRYHERGYNQVTEILRALRPQPHFCFDETVLTRTLHTVSQTSLSRSERLRNVSGAFSGVASSLAAYQGHTIVILDDVVTTGATLLAARAALAPHLPPGATIICVSLAH